MSKIQSDQKRGENNPHSTISDDAVKEIKKHAARKDLKHGWKSALARKYGISPGTVGDILSGRRR